MECIQFINVDLLKGQILADAGGKGAKLKNAMRKLDILGYILGSCGFLTDPERMNRVRHHLELADSIAEIKWIKYDTSTSKTYEDATKMIELAPNAGKLLTKAIYTVGSYIGESNSSQDFTKVCIASILWLVYSNTTSDAEAKKHRIDRTSEKVSSSGSDNKLTS